MYGVPLYRPVDFKKIQSDASWICGILHWTLAVRTCVRDYNESSRSGRLRPV